MQLMIIGTLGGELGAAAALARARGAQVQFVGGIGEAMKALRAGGGADMIFADTKTDIRRLCTFLRRERFSVPVIACIFSSEPATVAAALNAGARECIPLPLDSDLIAGIFALVAQEPSEMIARSPKTRAVVELSKRIAGSGANVLITGESGTGKEMIARLIHQHSPRSGRKMVAVNCAAIPDNLLESELFGHERGAFTGALARRVGKFEEASGATLLLDEISEMDPRMQAKLLRALQERQIDRVGGRQPVEVDLRVIATANRDLSLAMKNGTFREDLFYRLNVFHLHLPPLAERKEDIEPLARFFVARYCKLNQVEPKAISDDALALLLSRTWPGNVRELENVLHRAVLLSNGPAVGTAALAMPGQEGASRNPQSLDAPPQNEATGTKEELLSSVGRTIADVERQLILETLAHCRGNRTRAAQTLGISIRTLRNKLKLYQGEGLKVTAPGSACDHEDLPLEAVG